MILLASGWSARVAAETDVPPGRNGSGSLERLIPRDQHIPLELQYVQYGVSIGAMGIIDAGVPCSQSPGEPCILGSGGGLAVRGGARTSPRWYWGGAYEFARTDSSNLYRLGIFQSLLAEVRYHPLTGYRTSPFLVARLGGCGYGSEWAVETGGGVAGIGAGFEFEVSRDALIGLSLTYRPALLAGWRDTAGIARETGLVQFWGLEFHFELRSDLAADTEP